MRWENLEKMTWEDWYNLAKIYFEHHGNLEIPAKYKTLNGYEYDEKGVNLGNWIFSQKKAYKGKETRILTLEQIKMLENIKIKWFQDKTDDKLQKEEIIDKNKLQKQKEILNRFYSLLSKYDDESLPNKEDINQEFINQLNKKTK